MEPKLLIVRVDLLTKTLSGERRPLHCRDIQAVDGAYSALDNWAKWGYTILGLSDQSVIAKQNKPFGIVIEELAYTIYCFPPLEAIYLDPGYATEGGYRLDAANYCQIDRAKTSNSFLSSVLLSACSRYGVTSGNVWVASDSIEDEEVSSSHGVNFIAGDVWRVCLDASLINPQPLISFEYY